MQGEHQQQTVNNLTCTLESSCCVLYYVQANVTPGSDPQEVTCLVQVAAAEDMQSSAGKMRTALQQGTLWRHGQLLSSAMVACGRNGAASSAS